MSKSIQEIERDRKSFNEKHYKYLSYGQYVSMLYCMEHKVKIPKRFKNKKRG